MSLKHFTLFCYLAFASAFVNAADYIPTAKDIEAVDLKTGAYFAALDAEKYEVAYAMLTPSMKQLMNFEQWTSLKKKSSADLGNLLNRTRAKVTWYKDPQDAPAPGLYVAVDFKSNYQNADMHSEYVIWYRFSEKEEFKQMRHEVTFMLKKDSSSNKAKAPAPLKESGSTDIGYETVEAARTALGADPANTTTKMGDGWMIVEEPKANAFWSFSPPGHPAYPAVVKRVPVEEDGGIFLRMSVICQAKKSACDQLVRDFQELNEKMTSEFGKKK